MSFVAATAAVFLGALATALVGLSVARFFTGGLTRVEKAAWSFATGLLVQSVLFASCIAVFRGSVRAPLLALDLVIVVASFALRPSPTAIFELAPPPRSAFLLLAVAGAAWLVFLVDATGEPMWSTDYLAMWGLKGKTIFDTGTLPARLFDDPALAWSHPEYPLLVPLSLAAVATLAGGWHDQALALLFPLCELATLLALYGYLARRAAPLAGAVAAALTGLCFPLYRAVNAGMAEVPFALSLVLVSCAFVDALANSARPALTRAFTAAVLCVAIKQEGILFVLLLAAAFGVRRKSLPWGFLAPPALLWGLLALLRAPRASRDFDLTLLEPARWPELAQRIPVVVLRILGSEAARAWLPLVAMALFLLVTRPGIADALQPVLVLQVAGYAFACTLSAFDPVYAVESAFARIATTLFPAATLVLAARLPARVVRGPA